jgi:hypothetical protein
MKKVYFPTLGILLLALTIVSSCKKENQEQLDQSGESALKKGSFNNDKHGCRLVADSGLSDGFLQTYHYNNKGLADKFHISRPAQFDFSATMEYNSSNLMSKAKFTYGDGVFYDIVFTYDKNKLVKETWYTQDTKEIVDGYINTYNKKGQLVKRDEPLYELYCIFKYDAIGNVKSADLFFYDGTLYYGYEYSYSGPIRNPIASVKGLPSSVFFTDDCTTPYRFTGLKSYYNDELGNRVVDFNWESAETEIKTGPENYPVYQNSRDVISDTWTDQTWTYENCSGNCGWTHPKDAFSGRKANMNSPYSFRFGHENLKQKEKRMNQRHVNKI